MYLIFQVPTINQENLNTTPEVAQTLKAFRSDTVLRPTQKSRGIVSNFDPQPLNFSFIQ